ncbi:MAG: hypothetical protein QNJ72_13820 [Pleurocapsa sp. MO_226.B13]|nr:hypothetical protein [Pleurocapsa sp. MO_226.B13]
MAEMSEVTSDIASSSNRRVDDRGITGNPLGTQTTNRDVFLLRNSPK